MENELGMREIAHVLAPGSDIVSASSPEAVIRSINVIGVYHSEDAARHAVLVWLEGS